MSTTGPSNSAETPNTNSEQFYVSPEEADNDYYRQYIGFLSDEVVTLSTENTGLKQLNQALDQEASINPVSGFYNERGLQRRFDALIEADPDAHLAVVAVDLGSFKAVNDELGHHEGDRLLQEVGKVFRITDIEAIVSNPHGDEFTIVTPLEAREDPNLSDDERIAAIIERLKGAGAALTLQDTRLARLGFSISAGGVVHQPGATLKETLEKADEEMYHDKRTSLPELDEESQEDLVALRAIYERLQERGLPKRQVDKYFDR